MPGDTRKTRSVSDNSAPAADVEAFLTTLEHVRKREILALRAIVRGVDPRIGESIKWNAPSFFTSEHFATFHLRHRTAVQVVLHLGARPRPGVIPRDAISDPANLLEWRGADRAIVTFTDIADVEAKAEQFRAVLHQWLAFVQ